MKIEIGGVYENHKGDEFKVIKKLYKIMSGKKRKYYKIRFLKTGYETESRSDVIKNGMIKDKYKPNIYGIGYIGEVNFKLNKREYNMWKTMLGRCYCENHQDYKFYGFKGITVNKRWHCFENFKNDIENIKGWNKKKYDNHNLFLDKDINGGGCYSFENCIWVTFEENRKQQIIDNSKPGRGSPAR